MNMWLSRNQLAEEFDFSPATANGIFSGISKLIGIRYPRFVKAGSRVSYIAVIDYMTYKSDLSNKNLEKHVPDFEPEKIKKLIP